MSWSPDARQSKRKSSICFAPSARPERPAHEWRRSAPLPGPPAADEFSGVRGDHSGLSWKQEGDWRMIVRKGKVEIRIFAIVPSLSALRAKGEMLWLE